MAQVGFVAEYVEELRLRAEDRLREGASTAPVYRLIADELDARRVAYEQEELSIAEAVKESGYSAPQLRRLVREGKTTLRRSDLPRRPGHRVRPAFKVSSGSLADDLLSGQRRREA